MYNLTTILLHDIEGPINLGAICRAMANTGFQQLRLSGALQNDDEEAQRFAVHAREILDQAPKCEGLEPLIEGQDAVFGFTPRNPWQDGRGLDLDGFHGAYAQALARGQRVGLMLGNERRGLENAQLARCNYRVALPTTSSYASMNLSQAVMVVMWELRRKWDAGHLHPAPAPPEQASAEDRTQLLNNLHAFLDTIGFLNPQNPEHIWEEVQPLFTSSQWSKREIGHLQCIFSKAHARYRAAIREAKA